MEHEEQAERSGQPADQRDVPHGHEGSDREGGQVGVGVGGLGGGERGGTQSDQGRGYGAEGGSAREESTEQDMPHGDEASEREGGQVGVGSGGLGGEEWSGRRGESSGQGDDKADAPEETTER
jgi:hypothetical protein